LCPNCVIEAREDILSGKQDVSTFVNEKVGEIKAQIIERDGQIWMIKDCPTHGHFEDLMAIDSKFLKHIEAQFSRDATFRRTTTKNCTITVLRRLNTGAARF
jgi:uncharacterized radical SAM superfamily Fe-S cluster-containing enzyme